MRILVLGGDGHLRWPTAPHLSERWHDVGIVDSLIRRGYDLEMGTESLVPIRGIPQRVRARELVSRNRIAAPRRRPDHAAHPDHAEHLG